MRGNGGIERSGGLRFRICRWKPLMADGRKFSEFLSYREGEKALMGSERERRDILAFIAYLYIFNLFFNYIYYIILGCSGLKRTNRRVFSLS